MTTPRPRALLVIAALLMAPELGDCGNCSLPREQTLPAWQVTDLALWDAGFQTEPQRTALVGIVVDQAEGATWDVVLSVRASAQHVVTSRCTWSSWNLCFDDAGRPEPQATPPQPQGTLDLMTCPAVTRVGDLQVNSFVSLSTTAAATFGCAFTYPCDIEGLRSCTSGELLLVRNTGGPDFSCDGGHCTTSLEVTAALGEPGTEKLVWELGAAGWVRRALSTDELVSQLTFDARIVGPMVTLPCVGCDIPRRPEGLSVKLEVSPR
jgi:hypothetical protein